MQTKERSGAPPALAIFIGEGKTTMGNEIDYRIGRLTTEAARRRLAGPGEGIRQHLGHALMALGRAIHGIEPERIARPALGSR